MLKINSSYKNIFQFVHFNWWDAYDDTDILFRAAGFTLEFKYRYFDFFQSKETTQLNTFD